MKINNKTTVKKYHIFIILSLIVFCLLLSTFYYLFQLQNKIASLDNTINLNQTENFDILDFWEHEIERVNNTPLNVNYGENHSIKYTNPFLNKQYTLNAQEIYFDSPNWVNKTPETLRIFGYIFYPKDIKSRNPGCLAMHGLDGDIKDVFDLIIPYLEKGFIVLVHNHPGHGKSEGAEPRPENFYYQGAYNESAHFYLTLCAAIQGLRVLENLTLVDNSQIFVTGASYGGLNAMWLSSICGERISGVIPYIAIGDISKNLDYPSKLIFWVLGKSANEIPNSYLNNQLLRFDPIYYLKSEKVPPILWQIGTNDDFFHYSCIKGTFDAVPHNNKFLQIFPNEHHGFPFFENSTKYFIDYIINNGTAPPQLNITGINKVSGLIGESLIVSVEVNTTLDLSSVMIIYNRIDIIGSCWQQVYLTKTGNQTWKGILTPGLFESKVDFYIVANTKELNGVWFSSNILSGGKFFSNYSAFFVMILLVIIAIPMILIIRNKILTLSRIEIEKIKGVKRRVIISVTMIYLSEILAYLSLLMPWVIYEKGGIIFTHIYFFNNIFTWKLFFGEIASLLTILFFMIMVIFSILSLIKPFVIGFFKLIYPSLVFIIISFMPVASGTLDPHNLVSNFGTTFPGVGSLLMIISAIIVIVIGKWESNYYLKLGLRENKRRLTLKSLLKIIKIKIFKK